MGKHICFAQDKNNVGCCFLFTVLLGSTHGLISHSWYSTALESHITISFVPAHKLNIIINNTTMYYEIMYIQVKHPRTCEKRMDEGRSVKSY